MSSMSSNSSMSYIAINVANIENIKSISSKSFVHGDVRVIEIWNGFNFGNLLETIACLMEKKGEKDFNVERILFYTKDGERFDFGCDNTILNNEDYFNVAIIQDNQLRYAHQSY